MIISLVKGFLALKIYTNLIYLWASIFNWQYRVQYYLDLLFILLSCVSTFPLFNDYLECKLVLLTKKIYVSPPEGAKKFLRIPNI